MIDTAKRDTMGGLMVAIMGGVVGTIMHPSPSGRKIGVGIGAGSR